MKGSDLRNSHIWQPRASRGPASQCSDPLESHGQSMCAGTLIAMGLNPDLSPCLAYKTPCSSPSHPFLIVKSPFWFIPLNEVNANLPCKEERNEQYWRRYLLGSLWSHVDALFNRNGGGPPPLRLFAHSGRRGARDALVLLRHFVPLTARSQMRLVWPTALHWPTALYYINRYLSVVELIYTNYRQ
jgi:hypothetical protein